MVNNGNAHYRGFIKLYLLLFFCCFCFKQEIRFMPGDNFLKYSWPDSHVTQVHEVCTVFFFSLHYMALFFFIMFARFGCRTNQSSSLHTMQISLFFYHFSLYLQIYVSFIQVICLSLNFHFIRAC